MSENPIILAIRAEAERLRSVRADVEAEYTRLTGRLKVLAQMETLAGDLDADPRPAEATSETPADVPPTPVAPQAQVKATKGTRQRVLEAITALGSGTSGDVGRALGISSETARYHLVALAKDRTVTCTGAGGGRRYEIGSGPQTPPAASATAAPAVSKPRLPAVGRGADASATRRALIVAAIGRHGPISVENLITLPELAGIHPGMLVDELRRVAGDGLLQAEGNNRARMWMTTASADAAAAARAGSHASPKLADKIVALVAEDPGSLTEQRIAQALDVDREHVASVCGQLLSSRLQLNPDATYSPIKAAS